MPASPYSSPRQLFLGVKEEATEGDGPRFVCSNVLSTCTVCEGEIMSKLLAVELQLRRGFWVEKGENS